MPIRKSDDIENEADDRYENVRDTHSRAKITRRFDASTHNPYPGDEALQYLNRKVDDIIDEANALRTASSSFSTRATANDAKVSMVIGTGASQAMAGNTSTIATAGQTGNVTLGGEAVEGTLTFSIADGNLNITDGESVFSIRAG